MILFCIFRFAKMLWQNVCSFFGCVAEIVPSVNSYRYIPVEQITISINKTECACNFVWIKIEHISHKATNESFALLSFFQWLECMRKKVSLWCNRNRGFIYIYWWNRQCRKAYWMHSNNVMGNREWEREREKVLANTPQKNEVIRRARQSSKKINDGNWIPDYGVNYLQFCSFLINETQ